MRVNIIHMGFFYSGGGEKVAIQQAIGLRKRGHEVNVLSPIIYSERSYPELLARVKPERLVPHLPFPFPFRESSAMLASALFPFGLKKAADCDVLLCHSQPSMWLGFRANALFGLPYVGYLHQLTTFIHPRPDSGENWNSTDFMILNGLLGKLGRPAAQYLDKACHVRADSLLFNSGWTGGLFREAYGVQGEVCYPGIDDEPKGSSSTRRDQLVMAARHLPWKRIDLAFEVLKRLKHSGTKLVVTGKETGHTKALRGQAAGQGVGDRVTFTGYLEKARLQELFSESKGYIQTSTYEPFGMSIIEAQSRGTPAVVWGDAGAKEAVLDGETGFHAHPYDLEDFASKVDRVLGDETAWERMSRAAEQWAAKFTWKAHLDILEGALVAARK